MIFVVVGVVIGLLVFLLVSAVLENIRLKKDIVMFKRINQHLTENLREFYKNMD